ncbi:uncharacterized protein [Fopius arisanus]|uniref:Uncharacterized protein n=1 Tax=Fopius arisanus TaxID=64838 RepID=A0A9R1TR66_9HYME|nr:PREDICTED: uncharacterized protein LOC105273231 [Fopius arisanus]
MCEEVKVVDVLRVLREAKTIAVVDQVTAESPKVFVGPSNLDVPNTYSRFDLPYLSSLDTTRVERRVDKLPFFVAPLSFNPPVGYSKIPFPAPHIGSVIVNTIDGHLGAGPSGPSAPESKAHPQAHPQVHSQAHPQAHSQAHPQPLIEPNSFISSGQGSHYQSTYPSTYESPTTPSYSTYGQEHVTPQYQPTVHFPPSATDRFRFNQNGQHQHQQQQQQYQTTVHHLAPTEAPNASLSPYQEDLNASGRPHRPDYPEEAIGGPVTPEISYRKPSVVSSYGYDPEILSTTPVYENSYVHTRVQPNSNQELTSQLAQINQHDYSQHRHADDAFAHPAQQAGVEPHHGHHHAGESFESNGSYEGTERGTLSPTHYSLPAELPPIHPQLPGLVNSLVENKQERTTTTTTETPTTTEAPTSTYRIRSRQRGRVTRPLTTTTTPASVTRESNRSSNDRTRRPLSRSRSRYTTTTEEYKDSYEPTRAKTPETTTKYSTSESHRRTPGAKNPKIRSRTSDRPYESSTLNQIQNTQPLETVSEESNPSVESGNSQGVSYSQYNSPLSSESPESSYTPEIDYSKAPNYPRPVATHREQQRPLADDTGIPQQHYQDRYQSGLGYQASLIDQNDQYNYPISHEDSNLRGSSPPNDYYYSDKSESVEGAGQLNGPTENPVYTQILEYMPGTYPGGQQGQLSTEYNQSGQYSGEKLSGSIEDGQGYSHEASLPVEQTTEPITTTTESPPTIRQRVRGRLSSRTRQDSTIQTHPRGSQDDFVQFSAVTKPPGSRGSSSRQRDSPRRVKSRPHNQAQVQSEGEGFVRIQSSNRQNHPKTIVQTAKITTTTPPPSPAPEDTSLNPEDIEYGFFRTPSFNQPQHQMSSKFRSPDSQLQLQNVAPTDETAEDSSPSVTQVPKHRQKYQSPNRPRPDIKSTASSIITTTPSLEGFINKPKVRAEEPRNRIRTRVRRPGTRRRPATTTTTTTEYVLDGNNNLPLDENYPRAPIRHVDNEKQLYDTSYETLSSAGEGAISRVDYTGENYPQDFSLNFGHSGMEEQQDETSLSNPARKHQPQDHRHGSSSGRTGVRRRRVRIRVRPASSTEDFVTSESQHINSAVNNLVQDSEKPQSVASVSSPGTTQETTESTTTLSPSTSVNESIAPTDTTTINYTEVPEHTNSSEMPDSKPMNNEGTLQVNTESDSTEPSTTPQTSPKDINNESTINPEIATNSPLMTTMTVPRKSWDSTNGYAEWFKTKQMNYFPRSQEQYEDNYQSNGDDSYPKNHRSEWSEVRYPNDRGLFGYGRSGTLTPTTQLPGIVTKSIGDSSVRAVSDYVQAIFDTMKNADEDKVIVDNGPDLWNNERSTASPDLHNLPTDLSMIMGLRRSGDEGKEAEGSRDKSERKEQSEHTTTKESHVETLDGVSSGIIEDTPTTIPTASTSETLTTAPTSPKAVETTQEQSTENNEKATEVVSVPTKLGTILRTSTTTKVSHMTEICYRGRCVMTKPRKDFHARR